MEIYRPTAVLYEEEIHDLYFFTKMKYIEIYRPTAVLYEEEIHDLYILQKRNT